MGWLEGLLCEPCESIRDSIRFNSNCNSRLASRSFCQARCWAEIFSSSDLTRPRSLPYATYKTISSGTVMRMKSCMRIVQLS